MEDLATAVSTEIQLRLDLADRAESLEQNLREFSAVVQSSDDAIIGSTMEGVIVSWNSGAERLYGYSEAEAVGRGLAMLIPEDRRGELRELLGRLAAGEHIAQVETKRLRRDGEVLDISLTITPIRDGSGRVLGTSSVGRDITEQKRSQQAVRLSEERFRLLAEATRDIIYDYDVALGHVLWSDNVRLVMDHTGSFGNSGWWRRHLHPDDVERVLAQLHDSLAGDAEMCSMEYRLRRRDGGYAHIAERGRIIRDRQGAAVRVIGALQDITERRQAEERLLESRAQLAQAQKIDALGRLSGGMAHDFNNLLTVIRGSAEFLSADLEQAELAPDVQAIRDAADRAAELTKQLLAFSRSQVVRPEVLDVNAAVRGLDRMLSRLISENIGRQMVLAPDAGRIRVDPTQFEQVLVNLAVNARDAMSTGGTLLIRTWRREVAAGDPHGAVAGGYVGISVTDTGVGMEAETRERLFEPFFTTKPVGQGTGLGLATVYGIVTQAGGFVTVESEPGSGTCMTVFLPEAHGDAAVLPPKPAPEPSPAEGAERVLVVEDDPVVLGVVRRMLTRAGYAVTTASTAEEALACLAGEDDGVEVVLTDVVMPGSGGGALVRYLARERPEVPVVCMSGYTDEVIALQDGMDAGVRLVRKPFSEHDLVRELSQALHEARA